jgi:hypothetical protein
MEGSTLRAPEGERDDRADSYALSLVRAACGQSRPDRLDLDENDLLDEYPTRAQFMERFLEAEPLPEALDPSALKAEDRRLREHGEEIPGAPSAKT